MRIPSQFNEDSLYRRRGRSAQSAQSYRRLLRLIIGLALVLVLMRQAARPEIYQAFFGQPAVDANDPNGQQRLVFASGASPTAVAAETEVVVDATDRKIANTLAAALSASDQRRWILVLTRWQRGSNVPEFPSTAESLREALESLDSIPAARREAWESMLQSLSRRVDDSGPSSEELMPSDELKPIVTALVSALDEAADSRVIDSSVWRSGDFDAFYRYLDQAPEFSPQGLAATGVLPLLQQPDVFRGQLVRVHGTVARAEQIDASDNVYGIESYWQLWLRPSDGVERPLVAIVPEVNETIAAVGSGGSEQVGPPVVVAGRFLKRLAYTSSIGADLAPVVVGQIAVFETVPTEVAPERDADSPVSRLGMTIVAACVFGIALAAIAMWRTTAATREARRLRSSHRPDPNFDGLQSSASGFDDGHSRPGADV